MFGYRNQCCIIIIILVKFYFIMLDFVYFIEWEVVMGYEDGFYSNYLNIIVLLFVF